MGITSFPGIPSLTPLERVGPKGYLRYVFPLRLQKDYSIEQISEILKTGFAAAKDRLPILACEAVPDLDSKQAGVMKWKTLEDGSTSEIVTKDLRDSGVFSKNYDELKATGFQVSEFDPEVICRRSVWPSAGDRLPVSLVQANFIQGGLILSWCILHMAGDGTTFYTWTQIWAEECRRAQGSETQLTEFPDSMLTDREGLMKASGHNEGNPEKHPEYVILPFTPQGAPPKMLSDAHRGLVFYFSPEALTELKAEASPANATDKTDQKWVSTNDALSALLWRTVMAVQYPTELLETLGDPVSVFNIAIDGRLRTNPRVHPRTLGCFLEYVSLSMPIRKMLASSSLADLAIQIRKSVARADKDFTDDVMALVEGLEDVDRLVPTGFLDVPGFNCVQTSWATFALYDLDWGTALGNIEAVRSPSVGVINGLQVILPVLPNGGLEVLVGVEKDCLDRLLTDPLWNKFAQAVGH